MFVALGLFVINAFKLALKYYSVHLLLLFLGCGRVVGLGFVCVFGWVFFLVFFWGEVFAGCCFKKINVFCLFDTSILFYF